MGLQSKAPRGELRVAFLGAGVIAEAHARALRAVPGVELAAICDLSAAKAASFQRRHGIRECYTSIEQMREARIDVAHILLPPAAHAEAAVQCLERGWNVFVEKPMGVSSAECERIAAAAERAGRRVGVNHNYTFNPAFRKLVRDIQDRQFGRIENVTVCLYTPLRQLAAGQHGNWIFSSPGNIVLELGPHVLGCITRLLGAPRSATVAVSGTTTLRNGKPFHDTWQMAFECERGTAQCLLSVGRDYLDCWTHAIGEDGSAFADLARGTYRRSGKTMYLRPVDDLVDSLRAGKSYLRDGVGRFAKYAGGFLGLRPTADLFGEAMAASVAAFYEALRSGAEPPMGLKEGAAAIRACEMAIASGVGATAARETMEHYAGAN